MKIKTKKSGSYQKILVFAILLCSTLVTNAQTNEIIERISTANLKVTSITAGFNQVRHIAFMEGDVKSNGSFYYTKPDKLAMKYTKPEDDLMLLSGEEFVMIANGRYSKRSIKQNSNVSQIQNILSSCLQGDVKKMNTSELKQLENATQYIITAKLNKTQGNAIEQVIVSYDKKDMTLSSLQTIEADGSYTLYILEGKKLNTTIDESVFTAPERQTKK